LVVVFHEDGFGLGREFDGGHDGVDFVVDLLVGSFELAFFPA
jgi:hypothetical protein